MANHQQEEKKFFLEIRHTWVHICLTVLIVGQLVALFIHSSRYFETDSNNSSRYPTISTRSSGAT
ncbi:hypothetical protein DERF_014651 [Dermatophagoides farinae]|uniref:Uncharacterized protein n=1 Tax=Dermatophagoides farinae TaxID=6954 RepID=A0A922HIX3_DERFA|nr:hypothetical protein DERF_014651 [Dermatophagoides farinae]